MEMALDEIPETARTLPTGDVIDTLPFEAPWMTPFGAGKIKITALSINDEGRTMCQVGDENGIPYNTGNSWVPIDRFPEEWPQ